MQPLQEAGKVAAEEDVVDVDDEEDHGDIETGDHDENHEPELIEAEDSDQSDEPQEDEGAEEPHSDSAGDGDVPSAIVEGSEGGTVSENPGAGDLEASSDDHWSASNAPAVALAKRLEAEDEDPESDEDDDHVDETEDSAEAASEEDAGEESGVDTSSPPDKKVSRGGRPSRRRGRRGGRERKREPLKPIEEILQKGQEIVVQVTKDGIGTKGPALTTYVSLPGRFIVLMPGMKKRGVSRKVDDGPARTRLKKMVGDLKAPPSVGFIVRTAGSHCSQEELQRDLDYLLRLWEQMKVRAKNNEAPVLLHQENDLVTRALRDLYDGEGDIVVDDPVTAKSARDFIGEIMPEAVDNVHEHSEQRPLFTQNGIEDEIVSLLDSVVQLKSGISIHIEQTEALVAIDVNSGRYKPPPGGTIEDTAFQVNCEAAEEIARQIRLRDIGGVLVIDFIDMRDEKHRKKLERLFKDCLRRDRARIKVARFSPFGILEMTRQRVRPSLKRSVHQHCPYCTGTGFIPSDETSRLTVLREIRDNIWRPGGVLAVTVRPEVAEAVLNQEKQAIAAIEEESGKVIFIRADHRRSYEDCEIRAMVTLPDDMDHRRA